MAAIAKYLKIQNYRIFLKIKITGEIKHLEFLPFSYALKEMDYSTETIKKPVTDEDSINKNKLIAFYNRYDKGIYLLETQFKPEMKADLENLLKTPTKYKKTTFMREPFYASPLFKSKKSQTKNKVWI